MWTRVSLNTEAREFHGAFADEDDIFYARRLEKTTIRQGRVLKIIETCNEEVVEFHFQHGAPHFFKAKNLVIVDCTAGPRHNLTAPWLTAASDTRASELYKLCFVDDRVINLHFILTFAPGFSAALCARVECLTVCELTKIGQCLQKTYGPMVVDGTLACLGCGAAGGKKEMESAGPLELILAAPAITTSSSMHVFEAIRNW